MRGVILGILLALGLAGVAFAEPPPLDAYSQLPTLDQVTLSPSGQRVALFVRDAQGGKVYVRQIGGPILMAAPVGDGAVQHLRWAGDDILLVSNSSPQTPGLGSSQYAVDIATKNVLRLRGPPTEVVSEVRGASGAHEVGSRWYGYYEAPEPGGYISLVKVDLESGVEAKVATAPVSGVRGPVWVVDGTGAVVARLTFRGDNSGWVVTSIKLQREVAQAGGAHDLACLCGLGRTPDTVLVLAPGDDGFNTAFEVSLAGDAHARPITQGQEVTGPWTDPDSQRMVGYAWTNGTYHYVFYDALAQKRADAAQAAFRGYRVRLTSASRDFLRFIAFTDGGDDSGTYWLVDIATGKATVLGSAYPHVPPAATGPTSVFRYKAADGLPIEAVLTLPPQREGKALPLLVFPHDGPDRSVDPGFHWMAQAFASRGYAVLEPNYRGSTGYGKAFRDAGLGQWGRKMQTDLSDGVDALATAGVVDPHRVCILGSGGYGGYAAAAGVTLQHGRYRCAVAYLGYYDLGGLLGDLSDMRDVPAFGYRQAYMKYWSDFLGTSKTDVGLGDISPLKRADAADAPILLINAKSKDIVQQAPQMQRALEAAGKPVESVTFDNDDWEFQRSESRAALLNATVPFVEKYNPADTR
jgi:dipeptidyl aminopeptidase/acylaminoacyl peptidase